MRWRHLASTEVALAAFGEVWSGGSGRTSEILRKVAAGWDAFASWQSWWRTTGAT